MNVFTHQDTGLPAVMVDGEPKLLACLQTDPQVRQMFRSYSDLGQAAPEVRDISFRDQFGDMFLLNQRSHGSCFPNGTLVRMGDGTERPIEDIRPLESVVTAEGSVGRVLSVMARDEKECLVKIILCGHKHLRATAEHPILTKRGYVSASELKIGDVVAMTRYMPTATEFIQTSEHIKPSRYMLRGRRELSLNGGPNKTSCVPITVTEPPDVIYLTPGAGRIFGLFLAEGGTDKTRLVWTFHINEDETLASELVTLLKSEWGVDAHKQYRRANNQVKVVVYGTLWAHLFESLCATGSSRKNPHADLLSAPREFQEAMLHGWLAGDGHIRRKTTQGVTVSHNLAMAAYDIAQSLGYRPTIRYSEPTSSHGVKTRQPRWDIEWGSDGRGEMDDKHVWRKVQGVVLESFSGVVYNLHVEGDNSYVAEGIGVHNCVGFSSAGALMECRVMAGYTFQRLSGAYTYSFINGGRDQGASIGDSLNSLQKNGTCLESTVGWDEIYRSATKKGDEEAKRFKIDEGYRIESYDEALQAIMNGFVIVYAVMVGSTFDRLDSEDVVGYDRGPGNHAVHANGIYISQKWGPCLDSRNSWGSWGKNGWFRTARKHWEGVQQDAYAIRAAAFDPNDPKQPRVAI